MTDPPTRIWRLLRNSGRGYSHVTNKPENTGTLKVVEYVRADLAGTHDAARTPWTTTDRLAAEAWADWNGRAPDSRETLRMWLARWLQVAHDAAVVSVHRRAPTAPDPQTAPEPQPQPAQPHDPPLTAR